MAPSLPKSVIEPTFKFLFTFYNIEQAEAKIRNHMLSDTYLLKIENLTLNFSFMTQQKILRWTAVNIASLILVFIGGNRVTALDKIGDFSKLGRFTSPRGAQYSFKLIFRSKSTSLMALQN